MGSEVHYLEVHSALEQIPSVCDRRWVGKDLWDPDKLKLQIYRPAQLGNPLLLQDTSKSTAEPDTSFDHI